MSLDLVTTVESVEKRPDGHRVEVSLLSGVLMPREIQVMRARARAIIAVGPVDTGLGMGSSVARAINNMSFDEINRATNVVSEGDRTVEVHVYSE